MGNIAYIDNQNLYMATKNADDPWLLPSRKNASSLYKALSDRYRVYLDSAAARRKFGRK